MPRSTASILIIMLFGQVPEAYLGFRHVHGPLADEGIGRAGEVRNPKYGCNQKIANLLHPSPQVDKTPANQSIRALNV